MTWIQDIFEVASMVVTWWIVAFAQCILSSSSAKRLPVLMNQSILQPFNSIYPILIKMK